jgi:hypothetical protein
VSFTDQKSRIATKEDCSASWGLNGKGFFCNLCGHKFIEGDYWRWVHPDGATVISLSGKQYGMTNLFVCEVCDISKDVIEEWRRIHQEYFWYKYLVEREYE